MRKGREECGTAVAAVAGVWVRGGSVDWAGMYAGTGAHRIAMPTYAFQHQHYWLSAGADAADVDGLGQSATEHPLLGAVVDLPGTGELVLTGRLSLTGQPWLADHVVAGTVIVPGAALVDIAVAAGDQAGCGRLEELVMETPLVLPDPGGVRVRVTVADQDDGGRRPLAVYSQAEDTEGPWTRHATGTLTSARPGASDVPDLVQWPPGGAEPVDLEGFYPGLAKAGLSYGPAFQGVQQVWRRGPELFAEVELPEGTPVSGFGVHPALLDAALQVIGLGAFPEGPGDGPLVPFSWADVQVQAVGASSARVHLTSSGEGVSVVLADTAGQPVASVGSLVLRPLQAPAERAGMAAEALFGLEWTAVPTSSTRLQPVGPGHWGLLGADDGLELPGAIRYQDLTELSAAVAAGEPPPQAVLWSPASTGDESGVAEGARTTTAQVLEVLQSWLMDDALATSRLVVVTRRAVDAGPETPVDVVTAPVWGLVRAAAAENPGRFGLADVDVLAGSGDLVRAGVELGEPELAIRSGSVRVPRLCRPGGGPALPEAGGWRLEVVRRGTLEGLQPTRSPDERRPLQAGEVRVAVRAAGVNFRDVLNALGMYPGDPGLPGLEGAGTVVEIGSDVSDVAVGDAVMGLFTGGFAPTTVTDARLLARVPPGWSWTEAAAAPVVFLTAWYALRELTDLRAGESVLIHAAAGGVGLAAVQVARHLGAEVFGTASAGKWPALRALGLDDDHLASSRTLEFEELFRAATGRRGVDVVLNSLAGDFVDASMRLVAQEGRFAEMGKADIRAQAWLAQNHPALTYRAFDLMDAGPDRLGQMLAELSDLFAAGVLRPLPVVCWDVRQAQEAFRFLSNARNVGKVVLTFPPRPTSTGTVLVTGASGGLGGLVARHLAARGQAGLVLASRRGPGAPGVAALAAELAAAGARTQVLACDVGERAELAELVETTRRHLTGVIHAAGVLDDGTVGLLTEQRLNAVMRPKVDGAWWLHELTRDLDLSRFVLFSSASGLISPAGQGNYAAANTFLDALAGHRRQQGLAGQSLAWGAWQQSAGMAGQMPETHRRQLNRSGSRPLSDRDGLALLEAADAFAHSLLLPVHLDLAAVRSAGASLPPLFTGLVQATARRTARPGPGRSASLAAQLAALPPAEREVAVLEAVQAQAALVLGMPDAGAVGGEQTFRGLGIDSLTALELRTQPNAISGLRLPATMVFDYPTPSVLTEYICAQLGGVQAEDDAVLVAHAGLEKLESAVAGLVADAAARARLAVRLRAVLTAFSEADDPAPESVAAQIESASDEDVFAFIDEQLGT